MTIDSGITSAAMISGFAFGPSGQLWCTTAWTPGGVFASPDAASPWSRIGNTSIDTAYCLLRTPSGDLYHGSEGQGVWRLPAGSSVWQNMGLSVSQQFSLAADSQGRVLVGNDGHTSGVHRSAGAGAPFVPLSSFPSQYGYSIVVTPQDHIYVATRDAGVQRSLDEGQTWQAVNSGIPCLASYWLTLGPDGHLYAGSAGFGVFRSAARILPCPGNFDGNGAVAIPDIFAMLAAWFAADPGTDFNAAAPGPDIGDIFAFLAIWFSPCT
jgi:hypothetical protein